MDSSATLTVPAPTDGPEAVASFFVALFQAHGHSQYGGEAVSQAEHALQAASLAEEGGHPPALIVAALLHDVGHLLHNFPDDAPDRGLDDHHEDRAARLLAQFFPAEVVEPIRLHVAAKRYLCAREPEYFSQLSGPSVTSLQLQGGPMTEAEAAAFEEYAHHHSAVLLRRWDDTAKVRNLPTAKVEHFKQYLLHVLRSAETN